MVSVAPNHMFAWGLGTDSAIYWKYRHGGAYTAWTGWNREGGIWTQDPVVASRGLGEAAVFLVDKAHALYQANYNFMKDNGVSPFKNIGGQLSGPPAVANRKGTLHIFYVGANHALYHKSWDGAKYTPEDKYEELGGSFIYSPVAVSAGGDEVSVFAVGLEDGRLHHHLWQSNTGWQRPRTLPGLWVGTPSAVSAKESSWDVFGVDPKGKVNHISFRDGELSELEVIPGQDVKTIDAISVAPGTIDLIGWGLDSGIHHKTWNGRAWGEWENLGGGIAHRPSPVSDGPGVLCVIAVGPNCIMYIRARDTKTGIWGNWTDIQGVIVSRIG